MQKPCAALAPFPVEASRVRTLDLICLGRLAVDLYARDLGARLEDVAQFAKYLGGSSANVALGAARLGLKSAMLARVGDEHMGRFLRETLAREGCDVSQVRTDPKRLTALVILGIKDRETFPLIFYRENCADMAIEADDIDEDFIASSRALAVTGTHLSTPKTLGAVERAVQYARRHGVRTILDIDYRPVLWGLTRRGEGENRYVADRVVSERLQAVLRWFDLIVGTEEEFRIAGGAEDIRSALHNVLRCHPQALLVLKRGAEGCTVLWGQVPARLDQHSARACAVAGSGVEVMNVLGAGDAFLAGFLSGWLRDADHAECGRRANACGALVVSRHACAPAMPTRVELDYFLAHAARLRRPGEDAILNHLHRVTVPRPQWSSLCVMAFDHRAQMQELAQQADVPEAQIPQRLADLKRLLVAVVKRLDQQPPSSGASCSLRSAGAEIQRPFPEGRAGECVGRDAESPASAAIQLGILCDERYGEDALFAATGQGWWVGRPVELPGSRPLEFEDGGSLGSTLVRWPQEQVVKCLCFYHPDDPAPLRSAQEKQLQTLYQAVQVSGHELLIEIILPAGGVRDEGTVGRALAQIYALGIKPEWWKLEPMSAQAWQTIDRVIAAQDPYCRGVVLLGLNAALADLARTFPSARASQTCRGFMVGRSLWQEPAQRWLRGQIDDAGLQGQVAEHFSFLIRAWQLAAHSGQPAAAHLKSEVRYV